MDKIFAFIFLFGVSVLAAQTDSLQAEQMVSRAKVCLREERFDSSEIYVTAARRFFKEKNLLAPWLRSYSSLAYVWGGNLKNTARAVELIEKGLQEKWRDPVNAQEWEQYTMTLLAAGHVLRVYEADYFGAKNYYEKAQDVFLRKLGEHSDRVARYLYHNLGNIYTRLGDYERAISLFRKSLNYNQLHPEAKVVDHGDLAIALHEVGQHEEALRVVRQGLKIEGLSNALLISLYQNEGHALFKLGQPMQALQSLDKIPPLVDKMMKDEEGGGDAEHYLSQYHASKAEIHLVLKQFALAQKHGMLAVNVGVRFWETEKRREIGKMYGLLGNLKMEEKQPRAALAHFHHALLCVVPGFSTKDVSQLPDAAAFYSENTILEALHGKANAFRALGQLEKALECYELIPIVEAKLRATHAYESSSLLALKESRQRFQEAVDLAWLLFERSNGNPNYAKRAFRLTELARGMILLQSLAQARQFLPQDIRGRDYDIQVRIAWLDHAIAAEREKDTAADSKKLSEWERQRFDLKLERQNLLANFPAYNSPDSLVLRVLSAEAVRKLLRPEQIMVDYFLTPTSVYVFSFNHGGEIRWRKGGLPGQFREQTQQMAAYLWTNKTSGKDEFLRHAWTLDSLLIMPELAQWGMAIKSLVIVPDDVLTLVPFEALIRRPSSGGTWRDQPWLLKEFNLAYAYSATLLGVQQSISAENGKADHKPKKVFGGFAPSYAQSNQYQLQNTAPMVKTVRKMLDGDTWEGPAATEERFKESAANYRILLLAMHGISDNEQPELSRLIFGDSLPDSPINNNILYAPELQIMRLQADLAVLSACHSGAGKLELGEGVYSLARAFASAGVPATVMSLWLLHENTAPPLIEAFFRHLKQGKTKDESLRLAKLDYLNNDENFELNHPFYWAGLAAAGDMRALDLSQPSSFSWSWVFVAVLVLLVFGWFWKRRR